MSKPFSIALLTACFLAVALPSPLSAAGDRELVDGDPEPYYFYHGYDYGTDALIHPLRMMINGGFGITQLSNRNNRIFDIQYKRGWDNVWRNILDPVETIEIEGWWDFFQREVIPVSINSGKAHYWPNYTQHLIGGGMSSRMMEEWYRYHGYSHPKAWGVTTIMVYHFLNEVVESSYFREKRSTDSIADLYIFDPASILLFSSDRVCRFFSETLHMADWSYQPMIDPEHGTLVNNGQNFAFKWHLPNSKRWSLFYHYGTHAEGGVSYKLDNGDYLSVAAGLKADNIIKVNEYHEGIELAASGGIFYDRNHSLLASLLLAKSKDYKIRLNLYPGVVGIGRLKPSFFVGVNRDDSLMYGLSLVNIPLPVGLASGHEPTDLE